jgi:hypothetical protein
MTLSNLNYFPKAQLQIPSMHEFGDYLQNMNFWGTYSNCSIHCAKCGGQSSDQKGDEAMELVWWSWGWGLD